MSLGSIKYTAKYQKNHPKIQVQLFFVKKELIFFKYMSKLLNVVKQQIIETYIILSSFCIFFDLRSIEFSNKLNQIITSQSFISIKLFLKASYPEYI